MNKEIEVTVQVNGKNRANIQVPIDASNAFAREQAMANEQVFRSIDGRQVRKVIVVPGRIMNIVAR
jgi:leucyl-tRNA synthetase